MVWVDDFAGGQQALQFIIEFVNATYEKQLKTCPLPLIDDFMHKYSKETPAESAAATACPFDITEDGAGAGFREHMRVGRGRRGRGEGRV